MASLESFNCVSISKVKELQKIFITDFTDCKKILIATEGLSDFTNKEVFCNIFGVLDELYLFMMESDANNYAMRLQRIKANSLIAQIYSIATSISEISRNITHFSPQLIKKTDKYLEEIEKILSKHNLAKYEKESDLFDYENLKDVNYIAEGIDSFQPVLIEAKKQFEKLINLFLPKWRLSEEEWRGPIKTKIRNVDEEYLLAFQNCICKEYEEARTVLFDVLSKQGFHYQPAITDMRDALDHIAKSLIYMPSDPLAELKYASEHIRRAAVESIQSYVGDKYRTLNDRLSKIKNIPTYIFTDWFKVREFVTYARYNKADSTWYYSIPLFYDALKYIEKLDIKLKELEKKEKNGKT